MESLVALNLLLGRVWAGCKKYWQFLVGISLPILLWLLFRWQRGAGALNGILARLRSDHRREIEIIDRSVEIERKRVEEAVTRRDASLARVEAEAVEAQEQLSEKSRQEIQRLVEQHKSDSSALTRELSEVTGIPVWDGKKK